MRLLPKPGSPDNSTAWPAPRSQTACQRSSNASISRVRPTRGDTVSRTTASNRLAAALTPSTL